MWQEPSIQRAERDVQVAEEEVRQAEREEYVAKLAEHLEIQSYLHMFNYYTSNFELKYLGLEEAQFELAMAQRRCMEAKNRLEMIRLSFGIPSKSPKEEMLAQLEETIAQVEESTQKNREQSTFEIEELKLQVSNILNYLNQRELEATVEGTSIENEG